MEMEEEYQITSRILNLLTIALIKPKPPSLPNQSQKPQHNATHILKHPPLPLPKHPSIRMEGHLDLIRRAIEQLPWDVDSGQGLHQVAAEGFLEEDCLFEELVVVEADFGVEVAVAYLKGRLVGMGFGVGLDALVDE